MTNASIPIRRWLLPWGALALGCIALGALFIVYPLGVLAANSLHADGALSWQGPRAFLADPVYLAGLRNTIVLGVAVTIASCVIAIPFAYIVAHYDFPLKRTIAILPVGTIIIPGVIVCQSWLLLFGNNGLVTAALRAWTGIQLPSLYGWTGLVVVMTFTYYTYIYLGALTAFRGFDRQLAEASRSLGRSPAQTVLRVVLPALVPPILAHAMVVFTLVVGDFAIAILLGGRVPLLSVVTYNAFVSETNDSTTMQSTLSVVTIALIAVVLFFQKRILQRRTVTMVQGRGPQPVRPTSWQAIAFASAVLLVVIVSFLPLSTMVVAAFSESRGPVIHWGVFSLRSIARALTFGIDPILNSLLFASIATVIGTVIAVLVSYLIVRRRGVVGQFLDYMTMLPLAVSGTVLGIALLQAFNAGPLTLTGTTTLMVAAYTIRRLPLSVRASATSLHVIPASLEEASLSLGVSPLGTFRKIVLPLMLPSILSAVVLMWATTLSELSASIVVYGGGLETIPIAIYRQVDSGRMGAGSAYGTVLLLLVLTPVVFAMATGRITLFGAQSERQHDA